MKLYQRIFITFILCFCFFYSSIAQDSTHQSSDQNNFTQQKDLIDIILSIIKKNAAKRVSDDQKKDNKLHVSGSPAIEYSTQTGLAFNTTFNFAFYTSTHPEQNISSVLVAPAYTQKQQIIIPAQLSIWSKDNKYNFIGDWRFMKYPEDTYGLGGYSQYNNGYKLNYNYVRFYQFVVKTIGKDLYAGIGYQLDNHWNIHELAVPAGYITDFQKYGFNSSSRSSGLSVDFLYDNRRNSINPEGGFYSNIVLRQNMQWIGSDQNWTGLLIDVRKFIRLSPHSKNILAFWSYNWLTLSGHPPYLDLPSNGWDTYGNTGRGYPQSRFRSNNMIDLETEYRFAISRNGLIGGVVFANAETYSEVSNNSFQVIQPGYGAGLRLKFNKFSRTNICIDYGFGAHGSSGLFLNLGEVF